MQNVPLCQANPLIAQSVLSLQHPVKIKRFQNKKPTVLDQYNKRVRQAQAGGGANARAYALRQEELDEVKELKTQLREMEVNEGLHEQVRRKVCLSSKLRRPYSAGKCVYFRYFHKQPCVLLMAETPRRGRI